MSGDDRPGGPPAEEDDERAEDSADDDRVAELRTTVERETKPLQEGRAVSFFGNPLPVRTLIALLVFVAVFMVVWTALWALGGGIGLGLGWIPAAVAGALAVWIWARAAAA